MRLIRKKIVETGFLQFRLHTTLMEKLTVLHRSGNLKETDARQLGIQLRERFVVDLVKSFKDLSVWLRINLSYQR